MHKINVTANAVATIHLHNLHHTVSPAPAPDPDPAPVPHSLLPHSEPSRSFYSAGRLLMRRRRD